MGLFKSDKEPCPICGGDTPRLLALKVEDQKICKDCEDKISMGPKKMEKLTIEKLKDHIKDRDANAKLHEEFVVTRQAEVAATELFVDDEHQLFYFNIGKNPPIFKFEELKAFKCREWITGRLEEKVLGIKGDVPLFGEDDKLKKNRGMRTIYNYSDEVRKKRNSFIEILRDEYRGVVRWENIGSKLMGEDEKMLEDKKPIERVRIVLELKNKWWGKYKADVMVPYMNPAMSGTERGVLFNYINNYDDFLEKIGGIAEIMASILDTVAGKEIPVAQANDDDDDEE